MIFTLLTVLFIGLKLTGFINWSWWLVLAPTLVQAILGFITAAIAIVVAVNK